eukprot:15465181-Alexandrium_andersonii.AAC.1
MPPRPVRAVPPVGHLARGDAVRTEPRLSVRRRTGRTPTRGRGQKGADRVLLPPPPPPHGPPVSQDTDQEGMAN